MSLDCVSDLRFDARGFPSAVLAELRSPSEIGCLSAPRVALAKPMFAALSGRSWSNGWRRWQPTLACTYAEAAVPPGPRFACLVETRTRPGVSPNRRRNAR